MTALHPWNQARWKGLGPLLRLPASLLLVGPDGVGKSSFAKAVARALLCQQLKQDGMACGECMSCRLVLSDNHPDLRVLERTTEEEASPGAEVGEKAKSASSAWIKVDAVRALRDFLAFSAHLGGRKVVLVLEADRLHPSAANALLKTLEEPPPATHFLLVTGHPTRLPVTVRSRCVPVLFPLPSEQEALTWLRERGVQRPELALAQAGGAPLVAASLDTQEYWLRRRQILDLALTKRDFDVVAVIDRLGSDNIGELIGALQRWVYDLLATASAGRIRYNPDCAQILHSLAARASREAVLGFARDLAQVARTLEHPLNGRLVAERCLIGYKSAVSMEA
ncbi:MAG TPA: DNA polymerase III subunit delta' [Burkholderiales bacterium]|nr:DNA polymerase III subunit delta' [Burkholderiales bacterium]